MSKPATLFVVATPIGNLADFSDRGQDTLGSVDLIACEDTRHTRKLLAHFDIHTPTESYHSHSGEKKRDHILEKLKGGENIALVSDAGMPTISDPGMRLVEAAHKIGAKVVTIPGPSAVTAAVSISGLPAHAYTFFGFVPRKKGREGFFADIEASKKTAVFYESPHRFEKTIQSLADRLAADRTVVVCRELTKTFESVVRGSAEEIRAYFEDHDDEIRGEFVILVSAA